MKPALVLAILTPIFFSGCGGDTVRAFLGDTVTPTPVPPTPAPAAKAKASPTPGNWMWKDYQNPLDASRKKPKK
jgi:hypothetical protein